MPISYYQLLNLRTFFVTVSSLIDISEIYQIKFEKKHTKNGLAKSSDEQNICVNIVIDDSTDEEPVLFLVAGFALFLKTQNGNKSLVGILVSLCFV